ncbi:hypothetical protein [Pseudofulvibacter geojedonensis]|uniref:Uncharacterized protein n=1 Tax=Pseudofulvibacter geojedonensis TaxID=1123758 RepID=A0ABW3HYJ8_9FLAO
MKANNTAKLTPINYHNVQLQERLAIMQTLVFDEWEYIQEIQDKVDVRAFADTLLLEYFNCKSKAYPKSLKQLLYGYIEPSYRPIKIKVVANNEGIVYMPQIGYFHLEKKGIASYYYFEVEDKSQFFDSEGKEIAYTFEPLVFEKGLEVLKYIHPLLYSKYKTVGATFTEITANYSLCKEKIAQYVNELFIHNKLGYDTVITINRRIFISNLPSKNTLPHGMLLWQVSSFLDYALPQESNLLVNLN